MTVSSFLFFGFILYPYLPFGTTDNPYPRRGREAAIPLNINHSIAQRA
jgi:hypothetical protein